MGTFFLLFSIAEINKLIMIIIGKQILYFYYFPYFLGLFILIFGNLVFKKKIIVPHTITDKAILILTLYLFLSIYYISSDKSYGIEKFQLYLTSVILFYLPILYIKFAEETFIFYKAIFYYGIFLSVFGFMQFFGYSIIFSKDFGGRFTVLGVNPIWVGRYFSYSILVGIYLIFVYAKDFTKHIGKIFFITILAISQFFFIILTGSRGPLMALIVAVFYFIFSKYRFNFVKIIALFLSVILILLILYSFVPQDIIERILNTSNSGKITVVIRLLAYIEAINNFKDSILRGIGFGSYKFGGEFFGALIYPHNVFMEMLAETGLLGFLLFIFIVFYPVYLFWKRKRLFDPNLFSLIISLFIAALINSNLSGHIGGNCYLWFSIGIMYSSIILNSNQMLDSNC